MKEISESARAPLRVSSPGLKRLVVRLGFISEHELPGVLENAGNRKLISALARAKKLDERAVIRAVSNDLYLPLWTPPSSAAAIPRDLSFKLDRNFMLSNRCIPAELDERGVTFAFSDPLDLELISEIEFAVQKRVRVALASEADIVDVIERFLPDPDADVRRLGDEVAQASVEAEFSVATGGEEQVTANGCEAPPIVKLMNKILADAVNLGASDIHLVPTADKMDILFRVDGVMNLQFSVPKKVQPYLTTRVKLLSGMDIAERRKPQDGRFRIKLNERSSRDLRISVVPTPFGEKAALRLLRADSERIDFETLGMPQDVQQAFTDALTARDQMIVVCGPTGSGKSTTLYAAINHLNNGKTTIITVEDPIEFRIEGLTQIQVDHKLGITFASGLRSILRQDPDVILVGEIRDYETGEIAFQAAQTGHLVLTTLHTNDAPSAAVRLIDLGVEPYVISSSLRGVLAQRLIRKVCPRCAEPLSTAEQRAIEDRYGISSGMLRKAKGCEECSGGYRGRSGIYSFLSVTEEIRNAIRERASIDDIARLGRAGGMRDFRDAIFEAVCTGITTLDEAERVVGSAELSAGEKKPRQKPEEEPKTEALSRLGLSSTQPNPIEASATVLNPEPSPRQRKPTSTDLKTLADMARSGMQEEAAEPKKLVLVDDDENIRSVLARILMKEGYTVFEAEGGQQALSLLQSQKPDALVCDLMMPGMNGKQVVEAIRAQGSKVKVLMLTGSDNEENEIALIEAGADDFVSKGSSPQLVISRLRKMFRQ